MMTNGDGKREPSRVVNTMNDNIGEDQQPPLFVGISCKATTQPITKLTDNGNHCHHHHEEEMELALLGQKHNADAKKRKGGGLEKNEKPVGAHYIPLAAAAAAGSEVKKEKIKASMGGSIPNRAAPPSYSSYFEDASTPNLQPLPPPSGGEEEKEEEEDTNRSSTTTTRGAYSVEPASGIQQRRSTLIDFSSGSSSNRQNEHPLPAPLSATAIPTTTARTTDNHNPVAPTTDTNPAAAAAAAAASVLNAAEEDAIAIPVDEESNLHISQMMEAHPVDLSQQEENRRVRDQNMKKQALFFGGMVCLCLAVVLALSLVFGLQRSTDNDAPENYTLTSSSAGSGELSLLPPLENLDILYDRLPKTSKEELYDMKSPQYRAWMWLYNHPNVTNLDGWRKIQIYALAVFFFSFQGPYWPEPYKSRWMNVSKSECDWGMPDQEIAYWAQVMAEHIGPGSYGPQNLAICNQWGQIQHIGLSRRILPKAVVVDNPGTIPPEIGLLTSLRTIVLQLSELNHNLDHDLLIPELVQLPELEMINFFGNSITGRIPGPKIAKMTSLRHFLLARNNLSGTLPTQLGAMNSLEHLNFAHVKNLGGKLPSQLGLLSKLTALELMGNSLTGTVPTTFGLLTAIKMFDLGGNQFSGTIPTQLGLLTNIGRIFFLYDNELTGQIPSQLGLMTGAHNVRLENNNDLTGSIPDEIWSLSTMRSLDLANLPNVNGRIPTNINMPNLTALNIGGTTNIDGIIPAQICSINELDFDCSDLLCGCDCRCATN